MPILDWLHRGPRINFRCSTLYGRNTLEARLCSVSYFCIAANLLNEFLLGTLPGVIDMSNMDHRILQ